MLANHPGGFLSLFSLHLSIPHPPPRSLLSFFLRCMSAIHLSAVSASERYTELSLRISSGLGGLFCSCRSNTYFSWCSRGALLWKHKSTHTHTHCNAHSYTCTQKHKHEDNDVRSTIFTVSEDIKEYTVLWKVFGNIFWIFFNPSNLWIYLNSLEVIRGQRHHRGSHFFLIFSINLLFVTAVNNIVIVWLLCLYLYVETLFVKWCYCWPISGTSLVVSITLALPYLSSRVNTTPV